MRKVPCDKVFVARHASHGGSREHEACRRSTIPLDLSNPEPLEPLEPLEPFEPLEPLNPSNYRRRCLLMISIAIGSSETATMPIVTSEKFCLTIGTLPNRQPGADAQADPRGRADQVVERERGGPHLRRAGHERHERPDDRHEPAEDDRLAAVLLEERVRALRDVRGSAAGASPRVDRSP